MAAALAVDLVCALLVTLAIRVHDPEVPASPGAWLTIAGAIAAVTNATVALVAVILFDVTPAAPLLLVGIAAALFAAYRAFVSLRQRHWELMLISWIMIWPSAVMMDCSFSSSICGMSALFSFCTSGKFWITC